MEELLIIMADMLPTDKIVDDLKTACEEYQKNPSEENKNNISFHSLIFTVKAKLEHSGNDAMSEIKILQKAKKAFEAGERMMGFDGKS